VNFKLTPAGLTPKKKQVRSRTVTDLVAAELGTSPETTSVIIEEVATDNWGIGGQSVTQRRAGA